MCATSRQPGQAAADDHPPSDADPQRPNSDLLLWAYRHSIFPMADPGSGRIEWYSPDPRTIFPLHPPEAFRVPRNLARLVRRGPFEIRSDTAFERVFTACHTPRGDDDGVWMNAALRRPYLELFERGHAHSIEAWLGDDLVGGLYGVHIGGAFFGESMFTRAERGGSNSSKVCLVHLVRWLRTRGFTLLDAQVTNPHITQFGCAEIPVGDYVELLADAVNRQVSWGAFAPQGE